METIITSMRHSTKYTKKTRVSISCRSQKPSGPSPNMFLKQILDRISTMQISIDSISDEGNAYQRYLDGNITEILLDRKKIKEKGFFKDEPDFDIEFNPKVDKKSNVLPQK